MPAGGLLNANTQESRSDFSFVVASDPFDRNDSEYTVSHGPPYTFLRLSSPGWVELQSFAEVETLGLYQDFLCSSDTLPNDGFDFLSSDAGLEIPGQVHGLDPLSLIPAQHSTALALEAAPILQPSDNGQHSTTFQHATGSGFLSLDYIEEDRLMLGPTQTFPIPNTQFDLAEYAFQVLPDALQSGLDTLSGTSSTDAWSLTSSPSNSPDAPFECDCGGVTSSRDELRYVDAPN